MTTFSNSLLNSRYKSARKRLHKFKDTLEKELSNAFSHSSCPSALPASVYVTGSYGRLEASPHSDLDLFIVVDIADQKKHLSNLDQILLKSAIIRALRAESFPDPSDDGRFLRVHHVDDILAHLGSPTDDYENHFTARMLLLLESRPIIRETVLQSAKEEIIAAYYRDYHDHTKDFLPVFLLNDVLRFWRTLCLNYEHKRARKDTPEGAKIKAHLRNFKLKYSRLLTCYSFIIWLCRHPYADTKTVMAALSKTPMERIRIALHDDNHAQYESIEESYSWFLEVTGNEPSGVLSQISDEQIRRTWFQQADQFGRDVFEALRKIGEETGLLRYLVV